MQLSEPHYTYRGFALAGSHPRQGRSYRVTDRERVSTTGLHAVVGSTDVVALPERETLAVAVDMVRRIVDVDTMTARQLLPIVRATCQMVHHPDESVYRSAAMSLGIGSHDVDAVMSSADPWQARQHETKVTRSRKGRTSFKRTRVSMATVIGDHHSPAGPMTDDAVTDDAVLARDRAALSLMGARRMACGTNALDVQRAVDLHYRRLGLPSLEGTDSTSWARTTNGDRTSRTSVASHRSGIDGTVSESTVNSLAAPGCEYTSHTGDGLEWSPRLTLKRGRQRDNDPTDTRVFVAASNGDIVSRWTLIAPAIDIDHRWSGHQLVKRGDVKRNTRKTDAKRVKSVDIGTVTAPTTAQGWAELCVNLNRGEKLTATDDTGRVTISRNKARYVATDTRGEAIVKWQARTLDGLAARLATA